MDSDDTDLKSILIMGPVSPEVRALKDGGYPLAIFVTEWANL
jgi:hypothetical protein